MKYILFATTALVATAGIAKAEIALTGAAEMGIIGGEADGDNITSQFHTDIDVTFTMSGVADNGLTFGASVDLDEADDSAFSQDEENYVGPDLFLDNASNTFSNTTQGGETIFISFGGATLTMGDTDGAFDKALTEVLYAGGSINDDEEHGGYSGNSEFDGVYDGQIARFDYTYDAFTGSLSAEIDDSGDDEAVLGIGLAYSGDLGGVAIGVGLGYQAYEDNSEVGISADAGFSNGVTVGFNYTVFDMDGEDGTHGAIGIGYEMNALSIGANYGHFTFDGDEDVSGYGLAAAYDLGGGLEAQFGYGHTTDHDDSGDETSSTWSLGLAMSF